VAAGLTRGTHRHHIRLARAWNTVRAATITDIRADPASYYAFQAKAVTGASRSLEGEQMELPRS